MRTPKRQEPRWRVELALRVRFDASAEFTEHVSHDLSAGGLFIQMKQPKPVGTLLRVELPGDDGRRLSVVGRVVWVRPPAQADVDEPPGIGIKLIRMDNTARQQIAMRVAAARSGTRAGSVAQAEVTAHAG